MQPNIPLQPVESSHIEAIGHDAPSKVMLVRFKGGNVYRYDNVPTETFEQFRSARSIGSFFHTNIKPFADKFPFTKLGKIPDAPPAPAAGPAS